MSSVAKGLKGGLSGRRESNSEVLETARKKLATQRKMSLDFLDEGAEEREKTSDGRIDRKALADHVDSIADKAFNWILDVARPFFRKLDQDVADIGEEILYDICDGGDGESNAQRRRNYEERIEFLLEFSPEDYKDVR